MATPESLVKALAAGLIEGLLKTDKVERPKNVVVKTDDVQSAVRAYLEELLGTQDPSGPAPDLFAAQAEDDIQANIAARVEEAQRRTEQRNGEAEPGTYHPDEPQGAPWTSPVSS